MRNLILIIFLSLSFKNFAQTSYQEAMQSAFTKWSQVQANQDLLEVSNQFHRISQKDTAQWQPLYYAVLTRVIAAFGLPKEEAFAQTEKADEVYQLLIEQNNDPETMVLQALMHTVKVAKEPAVYGASLSATIIETYQKALEISPNNPRAIFHLAEYQMGAAKFWGKDPKAYCPDIKKSIDLLIAENQTPAKNFEPKWGLKRAQESYSNICQEQ